MIAILPHCGGTDTAAAKQDGSDYRDDESSVAFLGLFSAWGHLIVHEFFSYVEIIQILCRIISGSLPFSASVKPVDEESSQHNKERANDNRDQD